MSWKSYAAVSGATVLAGWLASPSNAPDRIAPAPRPPAARDVGSLDIEREAQRLQARVPHDVEYTQPQRNPFRFGMARQDVNGGGDLPDPVLAPAPPPVEVPVVAPPPPLKLSGIAEDQKGQQMERTAILSSPAGVLLLREGDPVLGDYRVGRIEREAVELVKSDGSTLRLTLRP